MEGKQYTFKLGFDRTKEKTTNMVFVQGDTDTYYLKIQLIRNNKPFNLEGAGVVSINFKKPDNERVIGKAEIMDRTNGIILYKMGTQEIMVQGMCSAEVQIYGLENKRITTSVFQYYVRSEFVQDEWIDSTTEYPIMTEIMAELSAITATEDERVKNEQIRQIQENQRVQADTNRETKTNEKIEELNEVQQKTNDKMDEIENRFTKLTTSQQQEAEIIDARKGKASLREKIDEIDTNINSKIDKVAGKQLSTEDYTTEEKNKLANIEEGANNYKLPDALPANMISEDNVRKFVSDVEKANWNSKETPEGAQDKANKAEQNAKQYTNTEIEKINNKIDKPLYSTPVETYDSIISLPDNTTNGQVSVNIKGNTITNLIENGNFANGSNGWNNWGIANKEVVTDDKGKNWIHIWQDNEELFRGVIQEQIPFTRNSDYTISFTAYKAKGSNAGVIVLFHTVGGGDLTPQPQKDFSITDKPERYSFTFKSSDRTDKNSFRLMIGGVSGRPFDIYITDIVFHKGNRKINTYIEGTKSVPASFRVRSVGKNLIEPLTKYDYTTREAKYKILSDSEISVTFNSDSHQYVYFEIPIVAGSKISFLADSPQGANIVIQEFSEKGYNNSLTLPGRTLELKPDTIKLRIEINNSGGTVPQGNYTVKNIQVNYGDKADYEPYKEDIAYITVKENNKTVNLNKVGDVYDEIDLNKGKLIKKTKEIILNGSEGWYRVGSTPTANSLTLATVIKDISQGGRPSILYNNEGNFRQIGNTTIDEPFIFDIDYSTGYIFIKIPITTGNLQDGIDYLKNNPLTLIYKLAEPEIIPVEIEGEIQGYENGTVYFTPYIKDKFIVDDTKTITLQYPIKAIDKILKLDTANIEWVEVEGALNEDRQTITVSEEGTYKVYGEIQEGYSTEGLKRIVTNINLNAQINSNTTAIEKINNKIYTDADLFTAMLLQQEVRITALEQGGVI